MCPGLTDGVGAQYCAVQDVPQMVKLSTSMILTAAGP